MIADPLPLHVVEYDMPLTRAGTSWMAAPPELFRFLQQECGRDLEHIERVRIALATSHYARVEINSFPTWLGIKPSEIAEALLGAIANDARTGDYHVEFLTDRKALRYVLVLRVVKLGTVEVVRG